MAPERDLFANFERMRREMDELLGNVIERTRMSPRAGARRLVITHISDELDELWARREAERTFGGPVEVAREGAVYTL